MVKILVANAEMRTVTIEKPNLKNPAKPYITGRFLPEGSDDFLTVGMSSHLPVGLYNLVVGMRSWEKSHFFDLISATLVPVQAAK